MVLFVCLETCTRTCATVDLDYATPWSLPKGPSCSNTSEKSNFKVNLFSFCHICQFSIICMKQLNHEGCQYPYSILNHFFFIDLFMTDWTQKKVRATIWLAEWHSFSKSMQFHSTHVGKYYTGIDRHRWIQIVFANRTHENRSFLVSP